MTINREDEAEWLRNSAIKSADKWFEHAQYILEGQVREIKKYRADFHASCAKGEDSLAKPGDILGWAVNSVSHIESNLKKCDTLRIAADLAVAHNLKRRKSVP